MSFDFKNAGPSELKAEYNRIANEMGDDQFFTKKELKHLPEILADGEQVLAFTSGYMDDHAWLITLTDQRIIFLHMGIIYGMKQVVIDLDKVNAITGETGLLFGKIKIEDAASEREIDTVWKETVVKFTNKARDAMAIRKRSLYGTALAQPVQQSSPSAQRAPIADPASAADASCVVPAAVPPPSLHDRVPTLFPQAAPKGAFCGACGAPVGDSKFCTHCGQPQTRSNVCSQCGAQLRVGAFFCTECGAKAA